jgi:hypothetical protein
VGHGCPCATLFVTDAAPAHRLLYVPGLRFVVIGYCVLKRHFLQCHIGSNNSLRREMFTVNINTFCTK